jgi:hypothetical protein
MLTADDLARIEAYCNAATPGPWRHGYSDGSGRGEDADGSVITRIGLEATKTLKEEDESVICGTFGWDCNGVQYYQDAEFIAACRIDLPRLLLAYKSLMNLIQHQSIEEQEDAHR